MRILIDNGHGLETPGKRSPEWPSIGQLLEWQYTRDLAIRLEAALQREQIPVQRIVPESRDVALWERVQRINLIAKRHGTANCLLVSLHVNASTSGMARLCTILHKRAYGNKIIMETNFINELTVNFFFLK